MTQNTLALDLLLVGAGGIIVAAYLLYGYRLIHKNPKMKATIDKGFALAIGTIGAMSLILTFQLFFTSWEPFPVEHYTELYGITLGIYSLLMLVGAFTLYTGVDLRFVSYFAAIGGLLMFQAVRAVLSFNLSRNPVVTAALYAFAGLAGLSFLPVTHIPKTHRAHRWVRWVAAAFVVGMSLIALYLGFSSMYSHIADAAA